MFKKDSLRFGILLGFVGPIIGLIIYYFISFYPNGVSFAEFLGYLKQSRPLLTAVSSLSLVANAVIFTFYINSYRDKTARGVFLATLVYALVVLIIKVVR